MDLYKEILVRCLQSTAIEIRFPDLIIDPNTLVDMRCYYVLREMKQVLEDSCESDASCLLKLKK